jgi:hypothetical protein
VNQHRASQRRIPTRVFPAWRAQLTGVPRASPVSGMAARMVVPILEASVSAGAAVTAEPTVGPTVVQMAEPTAVPIAALMVEPTAVPIAALMVAVPIAALMVEPTAVPMVARTVGLDDA